MRKAIQTTFDREKELILVTVYGDPTAAEYIAAIDYSLTTDPLRLVAWDYTRADLSQLSVEGLRSVMKASLEHPNTNVLERIALILPTDLSFGIGRIFMTYGELEDAPWELNAFRDRREAFAWLGVDDISLD